MTKSVIISGGGARVVWVQGLLASTAVMERFREADVYAGVSAGAMLSLLCARFVDDKTKGLEHVRDLDFKMLPHWGGMTGILVTAMLRKYVFSHRQLCDKLYEMLELPPGDATLGREVSVGVCDLTNNQYTEQRFLKGTKIRASGIVEWVAASASIYGLFQGWKHAGTLYQDGGYAHNVPVKALRAASKDSLILSLIPLNVSLPGSYGGNGFWKFLMAANITFYHVMYDDIGRGSLKPFKQTPHCIVYKTPHGMLYGAVHQPRFDFVLSYDHGLLSDLKRDGELAALECNHDLAVPLLKPSPPSRHLRAWIFAGLLAVVVVLVWWLR